MSALILTRYTTDDAHRPARASTDDCARRATTAAAPHRPGGDRRASARSDERLPGGGRQTAAEGREGFRTATCHMRALPTAPRAACSQIGPDAPPPPLAAAHWRPLPSLGTRGRALRTRSTQILLSTSTSSAQPLPAAAGKGPDKAGKSHAGTRKGRQCSAPHSVSYTHLTLPTILLV